MINITKLPGSLRLKYLTGLDLEGREVYKTRLMGNINPDVTDEDLYGLKELLEDVQKETVSEFNRVENKTISE